MSRIVRFHAFGPPEVLRLEEISVRPPGPGEVRIAVRAVGLNWAEVLWRQNMYVERASLPASLGTEVAGTIESVGPGVTGFAPGDPVYTFPATSQGRNPAYTDLAIFPADAVAHLPANVGFTAGAAVGVAYYTAYFALFEMARIQPGDWVLVTNGTSSAGIAAIQIAASAGARVIATARDAAGQALLTEAGAAHAICATTQCIVTRVKELTAGNGVRVAYDGVGGTLFGQLAEIVAPHGWMILYGLTGGLKVELPAQAAFAKSLHIAVYKVFEFTGSEVQGLPRNEAAVARAIAHIGRGLADGTLAPVIDRSFPLAEAAEAHRYLESGRRGPGKVVLTVEPPG